MRSIRRLATIAAIVLTPLASIATLGTPASAAVAPVLTIDSVSPAGNSLWVSLSLTNITQMQTATVTIKCNGTHSASSECFTPSSYYLSVSSLADVPVGSLTGSGYNPTASSGTFVETGTVYFYTGGTSATSDATTIVFPNLITGASYTVTAAATVSSTSLTAQAGSPSATVFTLGSDAVSNVTMTPAGVTDGEGQMGCYYYCYNAYQNYGVYTGSKVTVNWNKPSVNQSITYWSGQNYGAKTQRTYTPTGYAVIVLPTNLTKTGNSYNAMNRSVTWWQYLSSLQTPSTIAQQGFWNQTQIESDGCTTLESGANNWGMSSTPTGSFYYSWYVDGTNTTSVTLNGCHFARDEQYTAIVEPVYMPTSIVNEMTSPTLRAPYQWNPAAKVFPFSAGLGNNSYYSGGWPTGIAPVLSSASSRSYLTDGSAGNLSAEPGPASSVTAVPASTTDPAQKGTLKVSWTAPSRDLYFSTLSADVAAAGSAPGQVSAWGLSFPTKVTSGFQASTPTSYLVTAVRQDASAWFGYLGWNGLTGKSNYVSCTAVAPATTCTLTGLGTWTKYYVIVQAQTANATGWADFIQINPSTGTGSTIWPLAPSKPLNITASNPTTSSTQLAWDVPASVGGPAGVTISKYTATMVPQFVPVQQLTSSKYSTSLYDSGWYQTSQYGISPNGGDGSYWMDPLQGTNNYVGFAGYSCNNSSTTRYPSNMNVATCYNVFSPKGFVAKYDINSIFNNTPALKMGNSSNAFYGLFWLHNERDGYLFEYEMNNGGNYTWGLAFAPATSTTATLNAASNPPVVPGGPDFAKSYVLTTWTASANDGTMNGSLSYNGSTNAPVDAHMLDATNVVVAFATSATSGSNNPSTAFYKYTLNSAATPTAATKGASPLFTLGCYSSPQAVCDDFTTLKNSAGFTSTLSPVTSFSLNPGTGSIYFQAPWNGGGSNYLTSKSYRVNYNATNGTYGSPTTISINGSTTSFFGCYYVCGGSSNLLYTSYQQFRFDNSGKVSFPYGLTQYNEVSGSGDMTEIAGTNLPVQSWDWWFTPTWVGYRGYGAGGAVRTPGGAIFSTTWRWGGKATDQTSWNNYTSTLSVMLDSSTHTCTATAPSTTCTVSGTVKGAAYAITVYATNRESNGTTKDGPAGDFANVVAGVPNAPRYASATIGTASGNPSAAPVTITFKPTLKAGGVVDTSVTKYTCTIYDTSGTQLATVDVTPPNTLTPTTELTCTPPTSLKVGDSYILQMTATSSEGTSMPATAPQLVVAVPVPPQNITYDTTTTPASLTWGTPGTGTNKVTFYTGNVSPSAGNTVSGTPATGVTCTVSGSTCNPTGLAPNTTYTVLVCTTNSLTTGADATTGALTDTSTNPATFKNCSTKTFTTPAEAKPSNPTLSLTPSNGALNLSWAKPAENGTTITGYTVSVSPTTATTGCTSLAASATSCTLGGLTNGTAYTVTLKVSYTINGNAYTTTSTVSDAETMTPFAPPAAVAKPTATAGNGKATVSWTAVTAPAGMTINSYTVTSSPGGLTCTVNAPATTCDVSGLTNGTAYTFTVSANYTNNNLSPAVTDDTAASAASTAVTPQATAPTAAPTNITTTAGNGSVTVSFDAVTDNGGSAITSYTVTSSPGGKTCTVNAPATSCEVTGLTNGTAYTFTVKANNAKGAGPASSPSGSATPQATKPGAPTGVRATIKSATSLTVAWTAPTNNGGSAITSYTVSATDGNTTKTCTVNAPALTCDVTGLTQGTPYTVSVVATNYVGDSNAGSAATQVAPAAAPSTVSAPTATVGSTSAVVTWTAPASNGSDITKYTVTSSPGGKTCTLNAPFPDPLTCTVNGLTIGTNYTFTVTATNGAGTSTPSSPSNQITGASAPAGLGAPTVTAPANNNSNGQLTVNWKAPTSPNGTISGYTVTASPGGATCTTSGALSCTVSGLTNGTAYTFSVKATNQIGDSAASASSAAATPSTTPDAPTAVTATAGVTSATLSWTAPANNGGSAITKYTVVASPGGATCTTTGALTCKVSGLTNGTAYTFTVKATNINGDSPFSDASSSASPAPLAQAPTVTGATRSGNNSVTVNFTRPTDPSGAPVTGYVVTAQPGGKTCVVTDPSILSCTFDDLTPGTAYTFTVAATNRIGNSANSSASPKVTAATAPGAPTSVVAGIDPLKKTVDRSALVTWTAPTNTGGLPIKGYLVTASPGGATCVAIAPATSCKVTGLNNGTEYNFSVIAINDPAFSATATSNQTLASVPASTATGFTPTWSNQVTKPVDLTPPTGPTGGSTVSTLYAMPVTVHFSPTAPATSYTIKLNGKVVGTLSASACSATVCDFTWTPANKYILRPSDVITVTSSNGFGLTMSPPTPSSLPVAELHYGSGLSTVVAGSAEAQFLDSVAQLIKDNGYLKVTFLGYTDDDGSAAANMTLSQTRATNASNYLKSALSKLGVTNVVLSAVGKGISTTYGTGCSVNGASDGCAKNRRVSVTVSGQQAAPGKPADPTTVVRNNDIKVNWTAPATNGSAITGYTVYYTTESDYQANGAPLSTDPTDLGNWAEYCTTTTALTCTATAPATVANGTAYRFVVVAQNAKGESQVSDVSDSTTPATTAPDAPAVTVSAIGKTGLTINATAPTYTGGSDITGYSYTVLQGTTTVKSGVLTPGTPVVITGLKAATAYTVKVTATNGVGTSSAGSKAVTTLA